MDPSGPATRSSPRSIRRNRPDRSRPRPSIPKFFITRSTLAFVSSRTTYIEGSPKRPAPFAMKWSAKRLFPLPAGPETRFTVRDGSPPWTRESKPSMPVGTRSTVPPPARRGGRSGRRGPRAPSGPPPARPPGFDGPSSLRGPRPRSRGSPRGPPGTGPSAGPSRGPRRELEVQAEAVAREPVLVRAPRPGLPEPALQEPEVVHPAQELRGGRRVDPEGPGDLRRNPPLAGGQVPEDREAVLPAQQGNRLRERVLV